VGTCNVDIRGLTLGTSDPRYGSILRFGDMATLSLLNPSSTSGYAIGFTSEDQAVYFDPTSVAGPWRSFFVRAHQCVDPFTSDD
jgi:hypothetical protein